MSIELQTKVALYRSYLWYGDQKNIQKATGLCEGYVSNVLNGKRFNARIIKAAREIAIKNAQSIGVEIN